MTAEEVIEMEEALMVEYKKIDFQAKLHAAWKEAKGDVMAQMKGRQELTLPIQIPIVVKYGFEASKKGVAQSTAAVQAVPNQSEEMQRNHQVLMWLCDPDEQKARPDFVPDAELPEGVRPEKTKTYAEDLVAKGSSWIVVGGADKKGIMVRKGKELDSPVFRFRLAHGARIVAESTVTSNRLHYRKIAGDGPDFGWVTISVPNKGLLVAPYEVELDDSLAKEMASLSFEAEPKKQLPFSPPQMLAITA